ncbi:MAG TPA: SO_0444 family Cu/Zn efflux transporter [Planctomycetota bacterium]|nr:SO_0444 family Cu/Zn efflux transporter [Planctomycetota bacterium]
MAEKLVNIPVEFWSNLLEMAPYLLFGFLVAGVLSVMIRPETVERHLGGRGLWPVVKAAAFGVPLPLCSCGVIPVSASLRRHGASRGATTAFLLSTPQTGVDSFMVTLSLLGPVFAIFRPIAALATGIFGGALVALFEHERGARMAPDACQDACCTGEEQGNRLLRILSYGFVTLPRDIGKALIVGLVLAGIIAVVVPKDMAAAYGTGFVGMLVMMALGIPIYVCATASVPIAAALMLKGVSPGAALAFLITGPATNAATIAVIWKTMGRRTALLYLASVAAASLGCGALLNLIYTSTGAATGHHVHELLPHGAKLASAIVLMGVLAFALLWRPRKKGHEHMAGEAPETIELTVQGMTCSHCVQAVTRALRACPGVASAEVDLKSGRATVRGTGLDPQSLRKAVEAIGYTVPET